MKGNAFDLTESPWLGGGVDVVYAFFVCNAVFYTLFGNLVNPWKCETF